MATTAQQEQAQGAQERTYPVSDKVAGDIKHRFTHHKPHIDQVPRYERLRDIAYQLAMRIVQYTPPSREQALALTKLEEAVMHANSAIAREPRPVSEG